MTLFIYGYERKGDRFNGHFCKIINKEKQILLQNAVWSDWNDLPHCLILNEVSMANQLSDNYNLIYRLEIIMNAFNLLIGSFYFLGKWLEEMKYCTNKMCANAMFC